MALELTWRESCQFLTESWLLIHSEKFICCVELKSCSQCSLSQGLLCIFHLKSVYSFIIHCQTCIKTYAFVFTYTQHIVMNIQYIHRSTLWHHVHTFSNSSWCIFVHILSTCRIWSIWCFFFFRHLRLASHSKFC